MNRNNIEQILKSYFKYFPKEREDLKQLINFVKQSQKLNEDIFSSTNTVGHITASGFIYSKKEKKLLLLKHKKLGKWLQPGGHVEKVDKTILDTAKREIFEETGLKKLELVSLSINNDIPFDINTHFIPENPKKNMPAHYHHDFRFLFTINDIKEVQIDTEESNGYKWVNINELQDIDNMNVIIRKINKILNSDLKVTRYYNKIINEFNINLKEFNCIVVSHIIPDCEQYLEALNSICNILAVVPKPNSIDEATMMQIKNQYVFMHLKREEINENEELIRKIKKSEKDIIIFDIGGYFSEFIVKNKLISKRIKYIIEDTENGYQKYENLNVGQEILSVARSQLKDNEDYLVGESVIFSAEAILRKMGKVLEYFNCGIIGYGKIGYSIGNHLLQRGIKPTVYDINPIKQISALNRECNIDNKNNIVSNSEVLFLATGNHSLNIHDFRKIKNGSYIFSVTSSDDELDDSYLETEYTIEEIKPNIYKYYNSNNWFYLVKKGNAVNFLHNAVMDDFIYLVMSEMIVAAQLLIKSQDLHKKNNILETNESVKKKISKIWLDVFKNGKY